MPDELTPMERRVFGEGATKDPVTGRIFERGHGSLPEHQQAAIFLRERELGRRLSFIETQILLNDVHG